MECYYIKAVTAGRADDYKLIPRIISRKERDRSQKNYYTYIGMFENSKAAEKYAIDAGYICKNIRYNTYNARLYFTLAGIKEFI